MPQQPILIVGGAGYIGSHVNKMLHDLGYPTVVFDNLSHSALQPQQKGEFVQGDLLRPNDLDKVFAAHSFGAVMHFAALIDARISTKQPYEYYTNNIGGTLNLLDAMARHDVKRLIFSSTAAVYGLPQEKTITESHPKDPINPYGRSKLMMEEILRDFDHSHGIRSICLRYFNAAGGDPDGEIKHRQTQATNLIPILLKALKTDNPTITINGTDYPTSDGTCVRDYIHVHDIGAAHITAMLQLFDDASSNIYNLGNGQGYSVQQVIQSAEKITGKKALATSGPRLDGDPPFLISDAAKAARELGWKPQFPDLDAMIRHAWMAMDDAAVCF